MRKTCIDKVYDLAKRDDRVIFIGSDLSPGLLKEMKDAMPDRYYMEGITEANVIGMAAGLAMEGYMPYVNTIATFITRRCFEQVAIDLCLHNLPVRLIGNGGGLVYAPLGPTHLAIEDIAIMRALPNMVVTAACDAEEMKRLMDATLDCPNPVYIRLAKGGDPIVSKPENGFELGKAILMKDGPKDAVLFVTTGVATTRALTASAELEKEGIASKVLHFHTLKPFDTEALVKHASGSRLVVTVEEHTLNGGLGSIVGENLMDERIFVPVRRLGIPDVFAEKYGSQDSLMKLYGIQPEQIANVVREEIISGGLRYAS